MSYKKLFRANREVILTTYFSTGGFGVEFYNLPEERGKLEEEIEEIKKESKLVEIQNFVRDKKITSSRSLSKQYQDFLKSNNVTSLEQLMTIFVVYSSFALE